jgi:hypothetical protein
MLGEEASAALANSSAKWGPARHTHDCKDACEDFTSQVSEIMETYEDGRPGRPYRGDIWQADQAYSENDPLKAIVSVYDRRCPSSISGRQLLTDSDG